MHLQAPSSRGQEEHLGDPGGLVQRLEAVVQALLPSAFRKETSGTAREETPGTAREETPGTAREAGKAAVVRITSCSVPREETLGTTREGMVPSDPTESALVIQRQLAQERPDPASRPRPGYPVA